MRSSAARQVNAVDEEPSGEQHLTIVVTDLEQFTEVIERLGDAAALKLLRCHNRILRACLSADGGLEIAHTGDGLIAAFSGAESALRCAARMQKRLHAFNADAEATLGLRIGVHAGRVLQEEGRLFGRCVNVAVRVCAAARSGSILVSQSALESAATSPFGSVPIGSFALKGIREAQSLHELAWKRPSTRRHERHEHRETQPIRRT